MLTISNPVNAVVLFDGTNLDGWVHTDGRPAEWKLVDGAMEVVPGTGSILSKVTFRDCLLHLEFMLSDMPEVTGQHKANSGVFLQNRYEIQIESPKGKNVADPYNWKIGPHGIGAFCMEHVPDANAWRPNGKWHAFHFIFTAARWEGQKCLKPARATVWWNGVKVHDNVPIKKSNGGVKVSPSPEGLKLQEHGQDVRFRNIWILERSSK